MIEKTVDYLDERILVTRSSMPPFEEYMEEIRPLWETRWLTNSGAKHRELETALCAYLGVPHTALCVNGHQALECILETFDLKGEVITTPFTFVSTTNAIVRKGLTPVFCDINERDFTIDVDKLEALVTEKTCAIMPVHVYGNLCDDAAIRRIADKYGLKVIYDAAHAFGVKKNGVGAASLGDASMLSFHATKVFHTVEGGAAVFHTQEDYETCNRCKSFGMIGPEGLAFAGGNAKMNEFCAAMGLCNLRHIDESIASRRAAAMRYRERLEGVVGIQLSVEQEGVESNYAYFPIVVHPEQCGHTRDEVLQALDAQNIGARRYFFPLTSSVESFGGAYPAENTPIADKISQRVLCLPLYEGLSVETADRICDIIISLVR
ncbi:MAG: DegT/DnrJ/EryC1/StrS family aminotransferase [Clostridia bacterium]|nr:DegT/DnrJ/EryC1/StrS family aminotransferase [Clostridia bacterium]